MIRRFHDSLFDGHLGISRTVFRLQTRVYWPGLRQDVRTYVASCTVGTHGPCGGGPTLGESSYGLVGHVNHVGEGESLYTSDGGLFLSVDGGLSVAGQDRHFGGGCFLQ